MTKTLRELFPDEVFTEHELEAEAQMNEDERAIDQRLSGKPRPHDKYVLNEEHVAIPVGLGTWAVWWLERPAKRIVKQEDVGEFVVSTVFLGLDHSHWFGGPRQLFETMIFTQQGKRGHDVYCDRYATWAQAVAGHERTIVKLRAGTLFEKESSNEP